MSPARKAKSNTGANATKFIESSIHIGAELYSRKHDCNIKVIGTPTIKSTLCRITKDGSTFTEDLPTSDLTAKR